MISLERNAVPSFQPVQLRAFAALAKEGSYTRVARQLSYSEPAVHMQIKSLERSVGRPLVRREGQRVLLTPEGQLLLPLVLDILERNRALDSAIHAMQPTAQLVVGAGRHTGVFLLMPLLPEFRKLTEMVPELHFLPPNELLAGLVSDRFDLVVAGMPDAVLPAAVRAHEGIVRVPWQPIDWALVAQPTVVARRLPARPRNATTVFFPDYAFPRRTQLEAACRRYFPDLHLAKLETAEAVKSAVSNGLGAGVLPRAAIEVEHASGSLAVIAVIEFGPSRAHLVHKRSRTLKSPARNLVTYLLASARLKRNLRLAQAHQRPGTVVDCGPARRS